jgi:hypothetical protein
MSSSRADIAKLILAAAGLLVAGSLHAQYYDDPGLGQKPVAAHPQDYKPLGIRAGAFMLHPGVQLAAEYTDNAFYTNNNTESDTIFHIRPYLNAQSTWSRHSLNVSLAADIARHVDYDFRDYEDYFLTIGGRVDVQNRSFMSYGLQYLDLHEDLNSRDSEQGFEPTRYNSYGANLGYDHTFNRLSLGGAVTWSQLDYDDALDFDNDVIGNQDRDRDETSWLVRAGYQFRTEMQAFASYTGYSTDFDQPLDRNGYARSGDGYAASAGLGFTATGKLNGNLYATYANRSYDDPRLPETSGWGGGAGLAWTPTYLTTVYLQMATSVEDTTSQYSSGYLRNLYSLRVDHELLRFVQINGFVSYSNNDYELLPGAPANARAWDHIWRAGVGVSWFINRHLYLNASYDFETLDTNVPNDGYDVNRVWLTLGLER